MGLPLYEERLSGQISQVRHLQRKGLFSPVLLLVLATTVLLSRAAAGQRWQAVEQRTKLAEARTEGQMPGISSTFVRFTGQDGLELELTMPKQRLFDYTVMFWFRSLKTIDELRTDDSILNKKARLFELPGAVACSITRTAAEDPHIVCNTPSDNLKLRLADLPDIQAWMHLTFAANYDDDQGPRKAHCYIQVEGLQAVGDYPPMQDRRAYLSSGFDYMDGKGHPDGFPGDYRQFWYAMTYVDAERIESLQHEEKALDFRVRAYYKFDDPDDRWRDDFREQHAEPVGKQKPQILTEPDSIVPLCSSLPQKLVQVPVILGETPFKFKKINLYALEHKQREFGYTLSLWLRNFGEHSYSTHPRDGRTKHHFFEKAGSFALWWDSPISFRIYVYARNNMYEFYTSPVSVPLRDWVNIQVAISNESVTVMTFNENGQRLQLMRFKEYLAEQYLDEHMTLFESFNGIPYRLQFWETHHELPIEQDAAFREDTELIADIVFARENLQQEKWALYDGTYLVEASDSSFKLVYDKVPSIVNYDPEKQHGTIEATQTVWNGISCPNPEQSQIYFAGAGAGLQAQIEIERTTEYSVEFWFRPDWSKKRDVMAQTFTYLFQMSDPKFKSGMVVYVRDGQLKCEPYGLNSGQTLVFGDINPFSVAKWQHISCVFSHQRYIKGHYLAVNLESDGGPLEGFETLNSNSQTFYQDIHYADLTRDNFEEAVKWSIIVGNDRLYKKVMYGSFKEVRLWSRVRTDAEIFSERFLQAAAHESLKANFKLLDGSPFVLNAANPQSQELMYPQNVEFVKSDGQNVACPTETFFDSRKQVCATYPYTAPAKILYTTSKLGEGGYAITLTSVVESAFLLAGMEPKTSTHWRIENEPSILQQALDGTTNDAISFNTQSLEDGQAYKVTFTKTGADFHNFFVRKSQEVIPVRCRRVADNESDQPFTTKKVILGFRPLEEDVCFDFGIKNMDDCQSVGTSINAEVGIQTVPPMLDSVIDSFIVQFNIDERNWRVCIPAKVVMENLAVNRLLKVIFEVQFEHVGQSAYMHNVYDVAIAKEIVPSFIFSEKVIDVGSISSLMINANETKYIDDSRGRMSYRWECEGALQQYCDQWDDSNFIHFSNSLVTNYIKLNTELSVSVIISSFEAGNSEAFTFRTGDTFKWSNQSKPKFEIILLSGPKINVSATNKFSLNPLNFRLSDEGYEYSFALTPGEDYDDSRVEQSSGRTVLILKPQALNYSKTYKLTVSVTNTAIEEATAGEQIILFETGEAPTINELLIVPSTGKAFDTEFKITMGNYTSQFESPLEYVLYGVAANDDDNLFRITTRYQVMSDDSTSITMKLPELSAIVVRIKQINGETLDLKKIVSVVDAGNNVIELLEKLQEDLGSSLEEFWQIAVLIAQNTNRYVENGRFTKQKAIEVNAWISTEAVKTLLAIPRESIEETDLAVMRSITMAIDTVSDFKDYNDKESIVNSVIVAKNIILRTEALELLIEEALFAEDFIDALGDLFNLAASAVTADQEAAQRRRMRSLQQVENMETTVQDLFQLKTALMDLLCRRATANGVLQMYQTEALDLYVQKVKSDFTRFKETQFVSLDGEIQVILPIEGLINSHKERYLEFQELCIQVSFVDESPVPVLADYDIIGSSYIAHMGTLDNLGNRMVQSENGYVDARGNSVQLFFKLDQENQQILQSPQTKCMHIPGGSLGGDQVWSSEGCTYQVAEVGLSASLQCSCNSLKDFYYALVTDKTEPPGPICPGDPECEDDGSGRMAPPDRNHSFLIVLGILVPLFLMGVCVPFMMLRLDNKDYESVESNQFKMSPALIAKFQVARGLSCKQEVYFNEKLLHSYLDFEEVDAGNTSGVYLKTQHPLMSLFEYFDYRMSRLVRFIIILGQVSLITILVFLAYSKLGHEYLGEENSIRKTLQIAAALSIVTVPLPKSCFKCMQTELYAFKDSPEASIKQSKAFIKERLNSNENVVVSPQEINLDFDHGLEQTTDLDEVPRATLLETCMKGKRCFLVLVYLFWLVALGLCAGLTSFLSEVNEGNYVMTFLELSEYDAGIVVGTWYLSIFVFGYGILNYIRLQVISRVAVKQATKIFNKYEEDLKQSRVKQGDGQKVGRSFFTLFLVPNHSIEIALDIMFMIEIVNDPDRFLPEDVFDPVDESDDEKSMQEAKQAFEGKDDHSQIELTVQAGAATKKNDKTSPTEKSKIVDVDRFETKRNVCPKSKYQTENVKEDVQSPAQDSAKADASNQKMLLQGKEAPLARKP